ncbi:MAG: hypothetical protein E6I72_05925 [Chloroflexi bacterium]|nr:MAG: hypothetical protein E6I72_05925 [Chloroflexota bacterium]
MSGFSDDGRWWWDGTTWVATPQVVLPQLPPTEFEQSGRLKKARNRRRKGRWLFWTLGFAGPDILQDTSPDILPYASDYRLWTLEQLALATTYLLGPDEPMLAGETSIYDIGDSWTRPLAVAVTATHVVVFRIDSLDGQPRWIVLVGRPIDVKIESRPGVFGLLWPALKVSGWSGLWTIRGQPGMFKAEPVLDAWRQAVKGTGRTA